MKRPLCDKEIKKGLKKAGDEPEIKETGVQEPNREKTKIKKIKSF